MSYEAILFDMDGVIVDTYQSVTEFWQNLAQAYQVHFTQADFNQHVYGCPATHTLDVLFPHMRADELCRKMGVSQGTASAKSTQIMNLFDIFQMHPDWTLPSQIDENPMAWMIMVNGPIVDARHMPREIQEVAYRKGLIPYIPD